MIAEVGNVWTAERLSHQKANYLIHSCGIDKDCRAEMFVEHLSGKLPPPRTYIRP